MLRMKFNLNKAKSEPAKLSPIEQMKAKLSKQKLEPASPVDPVEEPKPLDALAPVTQPDIPDELRSIPERKLELLVLKEWDADVKEEAENFISNLEAMKASFDNPDVVGAQLRSMMIDLTEHPEFIEFLAPEDGGTMIKALRESYGLAVVTKASKAKGKKSTKKKKYDSSVSASLDELNKMMFD